MVDPAGTESCPCSIRVDAHTWAAAALSARVPRVAHEPNTSPYSSHSCCDNRRPEKCPAWPWCATHESHEPVHNWGSCDGCEVLPPGLARKNLAMRLIQPEWPARAWGSSVGSHPDQIFDE